jgi:hypothetical protein
LFVGDDGEWVLALMSGSNKVEGEAKAGDR